MGKIHSITKSVNSQQKDITELSDLELLKKLAVSLGYNKEISLENLMEDVYRGIQYVMPVSLFNKYSSLLACSDSLHTSSLKNKYRRRLEIALQVITESK